METSGQSKSIIPFIKWDEIDTLLLDMDGTLLDLGFDEYFWRELVPRHYAERRGLSAEDAAKEMATRYAEVYGSLKWYCLEHWTRELGIEIATLKRAYRHRIAFLPGALDFLRRARSLKRRVIVVTNAHPHALEIKLRQTRLDKFVDAVVSSHELERAKESPDFWPLLRRRLDYDTVRSCLIDDSGPVLRAAKDHGKLHTVAIRQPIVGGNRRNTEFASAVDGIGELLNFL